MSKSILQEVATFNAEMFNESRLKTEISEIQKEVEGYYQTGSELAHDRNSEFKILVAGLQEDTSNINEQLRADMLQIQIDLGSLEKFSLQEFAKYFYNTGAMRKEYQRNNERTDGNFGSIEQLHLQKLEWFTGPRREVVIDSENNFTW